MAKSQVVRVVPGGSEYIETIGEKFAELALTRTGEVALFNSLWRSEALPYHFVAVTTDNLCFFIEIRSYSACRSKIELEPGAILELAVRAEHIRAARRSPTPIVMLLSDADQERVHFLRLDTLPEPQKDAKSVVLSFPVENTITGDSIRALAEAIAKERAVPVAS